MKLQVPQLLAQVKRTAEVEKYLDCPGLKGKSNVWAGGKENHRCTPKQITLSSQSQCLRLHPFRKALPYVLLQCYFKFKIKYLQHNWKPFLRSCVNKPYWNRFSIVRLSVYQCIWYCVKYRTIRAQNVNPEKWNRSFTQNGQKNSKKKHNSVSIPNLALKILPLWRAPQIKLIMVCYHMSILFCFHLSCSCP